MFVFVLLVGNALKDVVGLLASGRLDWKSFFYLMLVLTPGVIPYALPLGLLTGVLTILGRLSANNEILAMKAAGLNIYRIVAPIFLLGLAGTALATTISLYYAPIAKRVYKETLGNIVRDDPLRFVQPKVFVKDFPGYILYIREQQGDELRDFYIWQLDENEKVTMLIKAETATLVYDEETDAILLTPRNATAEVLQKNNPEEYEGVAVGSFEETEIRLDLGKILGENKRSPKLSRLSLNELLARRQAVIQHPESVENNTPFAERIRIQATIQSKIALAFSVLSLCAIAIPLGIKASRSETYVNFAIALALALSYFVIFIALSWTEKMPHLRPDLLIWLPNIAFQGFGLWLLNRANQH